MTIQLKEREALQKSKSEELKKAIKVDANNIPLNYHWKEDQAKQFIDFVVDESNGLLQKFRVVQMNAPTMEIAKILDDGKLLRPGWSYKRTWSSTWVDGYEFGNDKISLVSKDIEWKVTIFDKELEDNIEGKSLENHIMTIVSKKIANEIVEAALYSRSLTTPNGDNWILNIFNGLKYSIKQNGNVIDWTTLTTREITRSTIVKAKKSLKTKYRKEVEVFMDSDLKTDLDELYNNPNNFNAEIVKTSISGMTVNEVPLMTSENAVVTSVTTTTSGTNAAGQKVINVTSDKTATISAWDSIVVRHWLADEMVYTVASITSSAITTVENLLYALPATSTVHKATLDWADLIITNPKNVVIWIQRDIKVEFERRAPDWYNVWYTMRQDMVIENPEACVLVENLKSKAL